MNIFKKKKEFLNGWVRLILESIPLSYSNIFFSDSKLLGIAILVITMLYPSHGAAGILGAVLSNTWAYIIGMNKQSIKNGLYGFNGVLVGLAIGFFYSINLQSILFLLIISLFLTLLTVFLNQVFSQYFGLPAMSMPFNITTYLLILSGSAFSLLIPIPSQRLSIIDISFLHISPEVTMFLSSFSAILFQPNPVSGLLIAIAILSYSRIAIILMIAGFVFALQTHNVLGLDTNIIDSKYIGFNYMFTALAIGGIFTVPGPGSLFLSILSSSATVVIIAAGKALLPDGFSPLAMPFNITVYLFLYSLSLRSYPSLGIQLVKDDISSPEKNLKTHHEGLKQWKKSAIKISLPFYGKWKVTQGANGQFTHKDDWSFAYDFQAVDSNNKTYKSDGSALEDYYSYGIPVTAPADGRIHSLVNDVHDNLTGKVNTEANWGNYVIIEHAPNYYSCLAHLKQGSIKVIAGQNVKKGEIIAACGNSGRSPYPHIHLQFQMLPVIGSPSISFEFSNLMVCNEKQKFITQGEVLENSVVQNMSPCLNYEEFFPYSLNKIWTYKFTAKGKDKIEQWTMDVDFYGNTILMSSPKTTKIYFQLSDGILSIKNIEGDAATGLSLMGSLLSEAPFISNDEITWDSFEPLDYGLRPIGKALLDILSIFGISVMNNRLYRAMNSSDEMLLSIKSVLYLNIPFLSIYLKELPEGKLVFKRRVGLKSVKIGNKEVAVMG
ncbi:MAG: urea transporter [Deltaproteobacteria bacterium]|nr:urea transporter [Deltaproteobacteria bacterium]